VTITLPFENTMKVAFGLSLRAIKPLNLIRLYLDVFQRDAIYVSLKF